MRFRPVLVVLVPLLLAGACGGDDSPDAAATTTTTTTTTSTSTTVASSTPSTEPAEDLPGTPDDGKSELEDGRHFGYWHSFEIGDTVAFGEFDLAYFLTGAEAAAAAAERGDTVEDDSYIVNDNPRLRTLFATGDTEVDVLASLGSSDLVPSNVADFAVDRHPDSGFWVTIEDGTVTKIEEQFVP